MHVSERHFRLLTDTIEAVNSTLDLEEVLSRVATAVADLLADPERARSMGKAGRARVESYFTWRRVASQLAGWLREAAA